MELPVQLGEKWSVFCLFAEVDKANVRNESWKQYRSIFQAACHPEREREGTEAKQRWQLRGTGPGLLRGGRNEQSL